MECNKEEALRAKEIAETKFEVQDFAGARKLIIKAQQLYPALENVAQMLAVCDVHCVAQTKLNGCDMDWYGILQLEPTADDSSIKKQYRKLALLLHPDKNKFSGAEAAFKLIGEAMGVLSDQMKRTLHDIRRRASANPNIQNNVISRSTQFQAGATNSANGHFYGMQQPAARQPTQPKPAVSSGAFWTICPYCAIKYQYLRAVENKYLLCQNCQRPFIAKDMHSSTANGANAAVGGNSAYTWNASAIPRQQDFAKQRSNASGPGTVPFDGFTHEAWNGTHQKFATNMAFQGGMFGSGRTNISGDANEEKKKEAEYAQQQEKVRANVEEEIARKRMKVEEKERKQMEKEAEKKARNDEKIQEALRKLQTQRKAKAGKGAGNEKTRKKLRKLKDSSSSGSDDDDNGSITLEDDVSDNQRATSGDVGRYPRRSSRSKRNVTYRVDASDDEDFVNFPPSKKSRETKEGADESIKTHAAQSGGNGIKVDKDKCQSEAVRMEKRSEGQKDVQQELAEMGKNILKSFQGNVKQNPKSSTSCDSQSLKDEKDNKQGNAHSNTEEKIEKINQQAGQPAGLKVVGETAGENTDINEDNNGNCPESPSESPRASSPSDPETFDVPDADFHDFDQDRMEKDIAEGQIWAAYDDQDGMPRFYLRVNKVLTVEPLKCRITWLESCPVDEEQSQWVSENLPIVCGTFKTGKVRVIEGVNTFSHLVKGEKCKQKGFVNIYPRKDDVWAIYKNWEIGWKDLEQDESIKYEYEMVEVLTDVSEKGGVQVAQLIKVDGFKTLFERQVEQGVQVTMQIPFNELLRFSHQVPAYKMTGEERCGVPKGSWELDPASVPPEWFHGESVKTDTR